MDEESGLSQWIWDKISRTEKSIDWVKTFFLFGLIAISLVLVVVITTFVTDTVGWLKAWYITNNQQISAHRYLLSATAQVLAAIFALVFSITLIATQFVTKYTHRTMAIIFPKQIFFYIFAFALAVLFPLWWLIIPIKAGSYLSVGLAATFVLSIPFFFVYLTRKMRTDGVINHLKKEVIKALDCDDEENAILMINALDNISMGAYGEHNYDVFTLAIKALSELPLEIEASVDGDFIKHQSHLHIFEQISGLIRDSYEETIDNPRAPWIILERLEVVGREAIKELRDYTSTEIMKRIKWYDEKNNEKITSNKQGLSSLCSRVLHRMAMDYPKKREDRTIHLKLIHAEIRIFQTHLESKWNKRLKSHLSRTVELMINNIYQINSLLEYLEGFSMSILPEHLFSYLDYYIEEGVPNDLVNFIHITQPIIDTILETKELPFIINYFIERFANSGEKCFSKTGEMKEKWFSEGMDIYKIIAILGSAASEVNDLDNVKSAIRRYSPTLSEVPKVVTNTDATIFLSHNLVSQVSCLLNKKQLGNDNLTIQLTSSLTAGLKACYYINIPDEIRTELVNKLWVDSNRLVLDFLGLQFKNSGHYSLLIMQAYTFYREIATINAQKDRPLNQLDVMVGIWVSLATHASMEDKAAQKIPINNIVVHLRRQYLDKEFYESYKLAFSIVRELDVERWLGYVRGLIDQERKDIGLPRLT